MKITKVAELEFIRAENLERAIIALTLAGYLVKVYPDRSYKLIIYKF